MVQAAGPVPATLPPVEGPEPAPLTPAPSVPVEVSPPAGDGFNPPGAAEELEPPELDAAYSQRYAAHEGERRTITIVMADLSGFTAMSEQLEDPELVTHIMNQVFGRLVPLVGEFGGYVYKYAGDMIISLFGAPNALEEGPKRAVLTALAMREELDRLNEEGISDIPLGISTGIATGATVVGNLEAEEVSTPDRGDLSHAVAGALWNLTAALEKVADRGQVAICPQTFARVREHFDTEVLDTLVPDGCQEAIEVRHILRVCRRSWLEEVGAAGRCELVGQEELLRSLQKIFDRAWSGAGQVVSLRGVAGIGKSRLAYEFLQRLEAPAAFYQGRCCPYGRDRQWLPFREVLRQMCGLAGEEPWEEQQKALTDLLHSLKIPPPEAQPHLERLLQPEPKASEILSEEEQIYLAEILHRLLATEAQEHPVVVIWDDWQWADEDSQYLLEALVQRVDSIPVLFLCLHRPAFQPEWSPLPHYTPLNVPLLDASESRHLLEALLGGPVEDQLYQWITSKTGGNPLYIIELLRHLEQQGAVDAETGKVVKDLETLTDIVPPPLAELMLARLDRLARPYMAVLQVAAVIATDNRFRYDLLQYVCADHALGLFLEGLQRAGLIYPVPASGSPEFAFTLPLMRYVAADLLLSHQRRILEQRAREYLDYRQQHPATG